MDLLIVGAGAMGRWFAHTMDDAVRSIAFTDADADVAEEAARNLDARAISLDADDRFDLVCLAVPISATTRAIADHAHRADRGLLDVSGTMTDPIRAMAEHAPERERVSLHPLFAPENAPGNVAYVADAPGHTTDLVLERLQTAGNALVETTADEHDELMETVQAKAHAVILAFALVSDDVPDGFSTPVYEELQNLVEQVTGGTPEVYAEIQAAFDGASEVAAAARRIAESDFSEFERLYREAAEKR